MAQLFLAVLFHFWNKLEKELSNLKKRTGWKAELVLFITNQLGEKFVVARDDEGVLKVIPEEEYVEENYYEEDEDDE